MFGINRIGRRLLQLDRPAPMLSDAEIDRQVEGNFRWNFSVNFLDGAFFWFSLSFVSSTTILPLFVSKLSDSPLLIALLAMLGQGSWYLPQLLTAGAIETLIRKKPVVVNIGLFTERLPMWLLPVAALLSLRSPGGGLLLFFVAYAWHGFGAGAVAPAWSDLIARCFPVAWRGRFFGITSFVGTGLGAAGAVLSGWILEVYPFPTNFALLFGIAALALSLSWVAIALTREPIQARPNAKPRRPGANRHKIRSILAGDRNFRNFLLARSLASLGSMGTGFLTVAAIQHWQVADSVVGQYTAALLVGQTAGNLLSGLVADRWGHKLSLEIGIGSALVAFGLALMAPTAIWYFAVFFLLGVATGVHIVSGVLIPLEFSRPEHRPTYVGIANTVMGVASSIAPILGGLLALAGFSPLFALSIAASGAALLVMRLMVVDPRGQTTCFEPTVATERGLSTS